MLATYLEIDAEEPAQGPRKGTGSKCPESFLTEVRVCLTKWSLHQAQYSWGASRIPKGSGYFSLPVS